MPVNRQRWITQGEAQPRPAQSRVDTGSTVPRCSASQHSGMRGLQPGLLSQETESTHRAEAGGFWQQLRAGVASPSFIWSSLHLSVCCKVKGSLFPSLLPSFKCFFTCSLLWYTCRGQLVRVLSFYHASLKNRTRVLRLGAPCFPKFAHLALLLTLW